MRIGWHGLRRTPVVAAVQVDGPVPVPAEGQRARLGPRAVRKRCCCRRGCPRPGVPFLFAVQAVKVVQPLPLRSGSSLISEMTTDGPVSRRAGFVGPAALVCWGLCPFAGFAVEPGVLPGCFDSQELSAVVGLPSQGFEAAEVGGAMKWPTGRHQAHTTHQAHTGRQGMPGSAAAICRAFRSSRCSWVHRGSGGAGVGAGGQVSGSVRGGCGGGFGRGRRGWGGG